MSAFSPTFAGKPLLSCEIDMPRRGVWTARVSADSESTIIGQVTISAAPNTSLVGTVIRGESIHGRYDAWIIGGMGRLGTTISGKFYVASTMSTIAQDACQEAGETFVDETSGAMGLATFWVRSAQPCARLLDHLANTCGVDWGAKIDGKIFASRFASVPISYDVDIIEEDKAMAKAVVSTEDTLILPRNFVAGGIVQRVRHEIESGKIRSTCWFA